MATEVEETLPRGRDNVKYQALHSPNKGLYPS